jgi:hypothetical protein
VGRCRSRRRRRRWRWRWRWRRGNWRWRSGSTVASCRGESLFFGSAESLCPWIADVAAQWRVIIIVAGRTPTYDEGKARVLSFLFEYFPITVAYAIAFMAVLHAHGFLFFAAIFHPSLQSISHLSPLSFCSWQNPISSPLRPLLSLRFYSHSFLSHGFTFLSFYRTVQA